MTISERRMRVARRFIASISAEPEAARAYVVASLTSAAYRLLDQGGTHPAHAYTRAAIANDRAFRDIHQAPSPAPDLVAALEAATGRVVDTTTRVQLRYALAHHNTHTPTAGGCR